MVTLKQLVDKENTEMKERRKTESFGCYYVMYICTIMYTFTSAIIAFPDDDSLSYKLFTVTIIWSGFTSISSLYGYLYRVKENGKLHNIFLKYKYIPIDINMLFLAKTIVLSKKIILHTMPAQILSIITRTACIYADGGSFLDIYLFLPTISGIIFFLILFIIMYINKQAVK